jgi:dehydrogenase/reductase SDR family member 4
MQEKFLLPNKVAIVTGSSKGIGEAIAFVMGQAGAHIVVSSRKQEGVEEVVARFRENGIEATGIVCNTGDPAQNEHLIHETVARYGGVDILVNNAATNPIFGPLAIADGSAFDKIMGVNVKGPFQLANLAYPIMKSRGGGTIINISSVEGMTPGYGLGLYSVSKSALIMLTKVMAREWGADNIRANVICPGLIQTKFSEPLWNNEMVMKQVMMRQPLKELGQPEDIAGLALMLASDAGKFCTGAVFTADGGLTI